MRSWTGPVMGKSGTVNQQISVSPILNLNPANFCEIFATKVDFVVLLLFCGLFAIVHGSDYSTSSSFETS